MRNCIVSISAASVGAGAGDCRSETGISTSIVPTLYGPVYSGNLGIGLRRERYEATFLETEESVACAIRKSALSMMSELLVDSLCGYLYRSSSQLLNKRLNIHRRSMVLDTIRNVERKKALSIGMSEAENVTRNQ